MAYVVTQACIDNKHTNCVDVCPVEAFREGPEMLYIDPEVCIDCNACISECPERAIFPQSAVPSDQQHFIALNAEKALIYPAITESIGKETAQQQSQLAGRFAVVGSGPSGFYAAEALLKQMPSATVDVFERLPTPFGLVRYGVAPDHPRIKSVTANFERLAASPRIRFFGNVQIGRDIQPSDLLNHYHAVVYATGGATSRPLTLPGADGGNIFGSSTFVGWYNGHPEHRELPVDLTQSHAVIIGMGNVALDIARLLILPVEQLAKTDIADEALAALRNSAVEEVSIIARRGPLQAAFTPKELEQLVAIPDLDILVNPEDLELDPASQAQLDLPEFSEARQNLALLRQVALREKRGGKRIRFVFFASPVLISLKAINLAESAESKSRTCESIQLARTALEPDGCGGMRARTTDETFQLDAGLIVHAIGYQGEAIASLPFDQQRGVIENQEGCVVSTAAQTAPREFVAGWIKRGASGVIGSNKQCASDTVNQVLANLPETLPSIESDIAELLTARQVNVVSFSDWQLLDNYEQTQGRAEGRARRKITDVGQMLDIIATAKAQAQRDQQAQAELPVKTHYRSCTLCEAMCGVKIEYQGEKIIAIAGDADDPHSGGHICPKGYSLQDLHNDPDRLKTPLEKVNGEWLPISWEDAFDKVAECLVDIQTKHGNDAVAAYWGNPASHNLGLLMSAGGLRKALGSKNVFTAASLDQMPHQLVSYLMFGHGQLFTIPDVDRTDYMLMLGANPAASNGSLMTAGDILKRMEGIKERDGKIVLIDPRRTESVRYVSEHHFIRPATDALFLVGLVQHIIQRELYKPDHLATLIDNWDDLLSLFNQFSLEEISAQCGISVSDITRIAEEFAAAKSAVCYGRMGVSTQSYGALNHWLMLILNILTGNLDRPGGMMFTTPAFNQSLQRPMGSFATYGSRVRGLPEFDRQLPTVVMAEEMLTPGEGQVKAFVCVAGNPALSTPNGRQMDEALAQLDFMVSIDFYLNETSRHADIILPPTGPLEHEQFDIVFNLLAVRNVAKFSEPLFAKADNARCDWDIMQGITQRIASLKNPDCHQEGKKPSAKPEMTPESILDYGLRKGPYGECFTEYRDGEAISHDQGLTLEVLKSYPHGVDLGPLKPCFPGYLFTEDKKIHIAPTPLVNDLQRLAQEFSGGASQPSLLLIGRRDLRTNNSWMHNSQRLVKGKDRCALFVNPVDAAQKGVTDKSRIKLVSRVGELEVDVCITEDVMPGVVSLPHGWGHNREGISLHVAQSNPGVSANDLTDERFVDALSGNAIFNGIPVDIRVINA